MISGNAFSLKLMYNTFSCNLVSFQIVLLYMCTFMYTYCKSIPTALSAHSYYTVQIVNVTAG